jgi:dolichol kinase
MTLEGSVRLFAGSMVLLSVALGYFVSPYWFLLTVFVGLNLIQSAFTKFCPAERVFAKAFFKNSGN